MDCNTDFIDEFGYQIFEDVFECICGQEFNNLMLISNRSLDREGNNHTGYVLLDSKILIEFVNGNNNGSRIIDYGIDDESLITMVSKIKMREILINRILLNN